MTMDQAATWLAGSILTALGFIIVVGAVIVINNMLHRYWKPVQFFKWAEHPAARFITDEEAAKIAPVMDQQNK